MIKFKCLIHKKTGTVISYLDWLQMHYSHSTIELIKRCYDSDRMIFGSDFEIIYDSEFTTEELYILYELSGSLNNKIRNLINERNILKSNLRIEQ